MSWMLLILAGLFEVAFTTCLAKAKESSGSEAWYWFGGFVITVSLSMLLLYRAALVIPMGTAYAVWTGIGAAGTALVGILIFHEPANLWRIFFLATLIASVIGLKAVSSE